MTFLNKNYITENGIKLGIWVTHQRGNKKMGKISQDKIDTFNQLEGWFWEIDLDEKWNDNYELFKKYMLENNNQCPICKYNTTNGVKLGNWVDTQRQNKKRKTKSR